MGKASHGIFLRESYMDVLMSLRVGDFQIQVHERSDGQTLSSCVDRKGKLGLLPSLKLTANAPENGWLEYELVSFWGV